MDRIGARKDVLNKNGSVFKSIEMVLSYISIKQV